MKSDRSATPIHAVYQERSTQFAAEVERLGRHGGKLVASRALLFLAGAIGLIAAYQDSQYRVLWSIVGALSILAFLALVCWHDWIQRRRDRMRQLRQLNQWQLARCERRWQSVPVPEVQVPSREAAVAKDLDLFGRASLFHLLNLAHTPRGLQTLRDWLLEPASPAEIHARQAAIKALTPQLQWREELVLRGHMLAGSLAGPDAFTRWAEGPQLLAQRPWLKWLARAIPLAGSIVTLGLIQGSIAADFGSSLLGMLVVANLLISVAFIGKVHDVFNSISTRSGEMQHYLALFDLIARTPADAAKLQQIQQQTVRERHGAQYQLKRLRDIMRLANLRHASLLSILYVILQLTILWDVHVLCLLEHWQKRCGHLVRGWFDKLGELEALGSLSCLAHDNPDWCFPRVDVTLPNKFQAVDLGHPLLADPVRVSNDVELGPPGTVLLVTGSNMSGKSTLLRAIGVNAVLAQTGGPACAQDLHMRPVTVTTSMRIHDSLEDGVSFFMAELKRLKSIVDQASQYVGQEDRTLLYLLDEILQGTNSVERHLAVARVLAHLVSKGAIGAVSTHDLDLATSPELAEACRPVHFRETLHAQSGKHSMTFDYKLRQGVATTTNALKLLELVGLVDPD